MNELYQSQWLIVKKVVEYQGKLRAIAPNVHFLMSLYVSFHHFTCMIDVYLSSTQLHPSVTPETIEKAAQAGVTGVKLYPQGGLPMSLHLKTVTY